MDLKLADKVALVTGGSRGIGKEISLTLASHGVNIVLCGRTQETLNSTSEEIRAKDVQAWPIVADVSRNEDVVNFVSEAATSAGRVDILVNNAVTSIRAPFNEQSDEDWQYHLNVKLMAYIRSAREVHPHMQKQGWGRIVNIGGMTARIAAPLRVTNGIVNAGVANFTKQFSGHVAPDNITVNCIHPGTTATDRMVAGFERYAQDADTSVDEISKQHIANIPMGRLIQPEDIANTALYFCSPLADIVTGQCIAVDGGSSTSVNY
jgi:3-oxoacyl-[acyl-carrier protein] reductase